MTDTTNTNDPKKLDDTDLTEVSGGAIPEKIMDYYTNLVPERKKKPFERLLQEGKEEVFLARLKSELASDRHAEESGIVEYYIKSGQLPLQ